MSYPLSVTISKLLKKILANNVIDGDVTLTTQEQDNLRAIISAASTTAASNALARANHTGVQTTASVTGLDAALAAKAPLVSPVFSGTPAISTTPAPGNNSALIANTAFVRQELGNTGLVVLLDVNPNKWKMVVTGTLTDGTDAVVFPELPYQAELNGKPNYLSGQYSAAWSGSQWSVAYEPGDGYYWNAAVAADDYPDGANWTGSAAAPATGDPTVTAVIYPGIFTGQLCRVGAATWYSWNGTTWDDITT